MNIQLLDRLRLSITLKSPDMESLGLSFDELDWQNNHSRAKIQELLMLANLQTGFRTNGERLLIEASPYDNGGCVLKFTILNKKQIDLHKHRVKKDAIPIAIKFSDINSFMDFLEKHKRMGKSDIKSTSLYFMDDFFYLTVTPKRRLCLSTKILLSEYGTFFSGGKTAVSSILEHAELIMSNENINQLVQHLTCLPA